MLFDQLKAVILDDARAGGLSTHASVIASERQFSQHVRTANAARAEDQDSEPLYSPTIMSCDTNVNSLNRGINGCEVSSRATEIIINVDLIAMNDGVPNLLYARHSGK